MPLFVGSDKRDRCFGGEHCPEGFDLMVEFPWITAEQVQGAGPVLVYLS